MSSYLVFGSGMAFGALMVTIFCIFLFNPVLSRLRDENLNLRIMIKRLRYIKNSPPLDYVDHYREAPWSHANAKSLPPHNRRQALHHDQHNGDE